MEATWMTTRLMDGFVIASCMRENVCLIHHDDSLAWAAEMVDTFGEAEGLHLIVDLSRMDFISTVAIEALANLEQLLAERSGKLRVRGVRHHVLAAFWAVVGTSFDVSNDPADSAALSVRHALAA